ncbi:MAG: alpha/beta fold hydrolase [Kangiellaceae bacterium]|nr:alpha/beta fold hydrolase [Kangiellaceae bacterium]
MKNLYLWLLTPLIIYIIYVAVFYVLQRRILFPVSALPAHNASLVEKAGGELISLAFNDEGQTAEIAYLPPLIKKDGQHYPVILLAHGNGNIIDDWAGRMDFMRQQGFAIVLAEYPGYGRSQGRPSYQTIKQAMRSAYQWIEHNPQLDKDNIVFVGRSMGGGAVLTLVEDGVNPKALILMSTYSSIADLAKSRGLPSFLVRDPFDNVSALAKYQGPSYLIHGVADKTVPISMLHQLRVVAHDASYKIYDTAHSDTPDDWSQFWQDALAFVRPKIL